MNNLVIYVKCDDINQGDAYRTVELITQRMQVYIMKRWVLIYFIYLFTLCLCCKIILYYFGL